MREESKIAVILEDHKLFADTMSKILVDYGFFESVISFNTNADLVKYVLNTQRTASQIYFFLDYYVGESTLPPLLAELRRLLRNPIIIIVSSISNPSLLQGLLDFKPKGIIHKIDDMVEFINCIKAVQNGNIYRTKTIAQLLENAIESTRKLPFSPREIELLGYFSRGNSIEATAEALSLSPYTIAAHRRKMFAKAKCTNITDLLRFARDLGI